MDSGSDASLVLASASPRRRRLFAMLDLPYVCTATEVDESFDSDQARDPRALVATLAARKACAARMSGAKGVIAAFDTVVIHESLVLGKPEDIPEARAMLNSLSGRTHHVVTGVALLAPDESEPATFSVLTPVRMRALTEGVIEAWIAEGDLLGCAGAYNIENHLAEVDLDQCYQNVAGVPLCHVFVELCSVLRRLGRPLPASPVTSCDAVRQVRRCVGPRIVAGASAR